MSDMEWRFFVLLPAMLVGSGLGGFLGWWIAGRQFKAIDRARRRIL